jgi:hypothetical protein
MKILDVDGHRVKLTRHLSKLSVQGVRRSRLIGLNILRNQVIIDSVREMSGRLDIERH